MTDPIPDDPDVFTSPLKPITLMAIGRFITAWAAIETSLPLQVAKLIASLDPGNPSAFAHGAFLKAGAALMGTPASASLMQLQNLAPYRKDEIKSAADAILDVKPKRDAVAHSLSGATETDTAIFRGFGASRARMGTDKPYSTADMIGWCDKLKTNVRKIDTIISELTGWTWANIREDQERWFRDLREKGVQIQDILPH